MAHVATHDTGTRDDRGIGMLAGPVPGQLRTRSHREGEHRPVTSRPAPGNDVPHGGADETRAVGTGLRAPTARPHADPLTVDLTLIDDISHNLGTPLTIIAGYAETLGERMPDLSEDDLAAATDAIRRNAQRAVESLRIVQARMRTGGSGTVTTILLTAWLRRMLAVPLAATGARVVDGDVPPRVTVDESLARQALLSTCHALLGADGPASEIRVDAAAGGPGAVFVVTGVGVVGLRPEHLAMLEVTAALLTDAGGGHERLADGARHVLRVPASGPGNVPAPRIPVAVVVDDPTTASVVRTSLRSSSDVFRIVVDEPALEAGVAAVAGSQPRLLVLGQHRPDGDVTDALDRIHDAAPSTTIVVLSTGRPGTEDEPRAGGGTHWLHEDRVLGDLRTELLRVLAPG